MERQPSMILSIIIPCLNEENRLPATLEALMPQIRSCEGAEVIVVDGGSADRTVAIAKKYGAQVVECEKGHGRQRNAGAKCAKGEWLAFLDADCTVNPNWLKLGLEIICTGEYDMFAGPIHLPMDGTWIERSWNSHFRSRWLRGIKEQIPTNAYQLITTGSVFVSRKLFNTIGGFNETLYSGEDTCFSFTVWERKGRIGLIDGLWFIHRGEPKSLRDFFNQQVWHCNTSVWKLLASSARSRKVGQNAYKYGIYQIFTLLLTVFSIPVAILFHQGYLPWLFLCLYALPPIAFATRACFATGDFPCFPGLAVLYSAYGLARAGYILKLTKITDKAKRF